jgi:hypothetical protein
MEITMTKNSSTHLTLLLSSLILLGCSTLSEPSEEPCDAKGFQPHSTGDYWIYELIDDITGAIRKDSTVVASTWDSAGTTFCTLHRFIDDTLYSRISVKVSADSVVDVLPSFDDDLRSQNVSFDAYGGSFDCKCPPIRRRLVSCQNNVDTSYSTAPGDTLPSLGPNGDVIYSIVEFRRKSTASMFQSTFKHSEFQDFDSSPSASTPIHVVNVNISDSVCIVEPENAVMVTTGLRHMTSDIAFTRTYVQGIGIVYERVLRTVYTAADSSRSEKSHYRRQLLRFTVNK